jgi:hypothetical protein
MLVMLLIWRVLYANKQEGKNILLLSNELPGEAWLEFKIIVTPIPIRNIQTRWNMG